MRCALLSLSLREPDFSSRCSGTGGAALSVECRNELYLILKGSKDRPVVSFLKDYLLICKANNLHIH